MKLFAAMMVQVAMAAEGDGSWQWVDVKGTQCMNGKQTGVYIRHSQKGNKGLGVYLYGGGACFNAETCEFASSKNPKPGNMGSGGIFASRDDNPLDDYNWITVPYCTGDIHFGENVETIALAKRRFSGANNIRLIMEMATSTFTDIETVFVTGESAGGFGSFAAYPAIRDAYPSARGVLMDDSGQVLDDDNLPVCLVESWRQVWNLNKNLPADCPCNNNEGNISSAWAYYRQKYPQDSFSLISSINDAVISTFFAFGEDDCKAVLPVGYKNMHRGLKALAASGVNIFMIPGAGHTHTSHGEFYSRQVSGINMNQWIAQLLDPNQDDPATVEPTSEDIMREVMLRPEQPDSGVIV